MKTVQAPALTDPLIEWFQADPLTGFIVAVAVFMAVSYLVKDWF